MKIMNLDVNHSDFLALSNCTLTFVVLQALFEKAVAFASAVDFSRSKTPDTVKYVAK